MTGFLDFDGRLLAASARRRAGRQHLARRRPRHSLVVGSRLSEVTTFLSPELLPSEGLLHVDRDPRAFGAAFPGVACLGIVSDAQTFFAALEARAQETGWFARRAPPPMMPSAPPPATTTVAELTSTGESGPVEARPDTRETAVMPFWGMVV